MNWRAPRAAPLFLFAALVFSPGLTSAAQDYDYNYGAERAAVTQQPKMDVDSFDGSFTYEYPLKLPPGRNGMEPKLSLIYSSKNTEQVSPFGYGWSISIPYIERMNERGVNNLYSTTTNLFSSLDGELRATSTATTTEFGALSDDGSFRKYEFIDQAYWKVTDKSGTQYIFGTSSLSQLVDNASSTRVFRWMLEKVQDKSGNYVKYEYQKDNNQIYPYKVKYTGNGSVDGIYEIEFARESRSDIATSSRAGFEVVSKERVKEVYIRAGTDLAKSYQLGYGTGDNGQRSLLASLLEAGRSEAGATSTMPTTTLAYSIPTEGWTLDSSWVMPEYFVDDTIYPEEGDMGDRFDDFNGDGLVDLVDARDNDGETDKLYFNHGDGSWGTTTPSGMKGMANYLAEGVNARVVDVDGDGLSDFVTGWSSTTLNTNKGASFVADPAWTSPITFVGTTSGIYYDAGGRIVDLNGDGLPDLAKSYASTTNPILEAANGIYLNNGAGWDATSTNAWTLPTEQPFAAYFGSSEGVNHGANFADFNADGLMDILYSREDGTPPYTYIYFNDGDGTWTESVPSGDIATTTGFFPDHGGDHYGYRIADVNSDGLPDIVHTKGASGYTVFKNKDGGRTFERDASWGTMPVRFVCVYGGPEGCGLSDDLGGRFVDINGDGIVDILRWDDATDHGNYRESYLGNAIVPGDMLTTIGSSRIGSTTIGYKSTAEYRDSTGTLSNPYLPINFQTVETITRYNMVANGIVGTTTYHYGGGEYYYANEFDRKFGGFATTTVTDPLGNVTKTFSHQGNGTQTAIGEASDDRSMIGKPFRVEIYSGTTTLYKKAFTKWENVSLSNGRKLVLKTQELEMDYDGDSDHKDKGTTYEYDSANGNLLTVIEHGEVTGSDDGSFNTGTDAGNSHSLDLEDTSDQYAYISDASQTGLDITGDITINAWLKFESTNWPQDAINVVRKWDGGTSYIFAIGEDDGSGNDFFSFSNDDGVDVETTQLSYTGALGTSNWRMITLTKIGTTATIYVDGTAIGTGTNNATTQDAGGEFDVGGSQSALATMDGLMDEWAIWSRGLSASEVTSLYNSNNGQTYDTMSSALKIDLEGYWGFNNSYTDASGNGNTLTANGSPAFSVVVPFEAYTNAAFDRKTVYSYLSSTTAPVVSILKSETVLDSNSATTSERRLYYDGLGLGSVGKGDLTKEERWASSTAYISTQWAYNDYGLVTTETDPRGKQTTFSYSNNLFVATTTNPLSQTTEFYRDFSSGKVKKRVDSNGLSWETVYDGLDRPTEEKIPDHLGTPSSTVTAKTYIYSDAPGSRSVQETVYLNGATSTDRYTYLDGFERKIQERTEAESTYVVKDWEYDARGQLKRETLPYFSSGSARTSSIGTAELLVGYGYDPLGRVATTTNAEGTASTTYDQWTETVTDRNGESKRYVYDAFRNLAAVGEVTATTTATTTYAYDALNNLGTTTDALGNIRVFTYDGLSRLLSAQDLHAANDTNYGIRLYGYDAAGNIASTTDPKGQNVQFTYDDINRVLTEDYTGSVGTEIQYAYDVCTYGIGRLCSATTTESVTNLVYDALGNVITSTRVINNATSTMTFAYDRAKNPISMRYPNGILANYEYNAAGLLERLWLQTGTTTIVTVIASSTDYGPTGQAVQRSLGNGLVTNYTFDDTALYRLTNVFTSLGEVTVSTTSALTENLISYWPFDNSANDSHSSNDLTSHGSPSYTASGLVGYAVDLEDASDQYFSIADASQTGLDVLGDITINAWLKFESTNWPHDAINVARKWDGGTSYIFAIGEDDGSGNDFFSYSNHDGVDVETTQLSYTGALGTSNWRMITLTKIGTTATVYVDGTAIGTGTNNATTQDAGGEFDVGGSSAALATMDGLVDEWSIWSRGLSADEVTSLYNSGAGRAYTDLSTTTSAASSTGPVIQDFTYTYDPVGNILTLTDNSVGGSGHSVSYSYDDLHRLALASTTLASSTPFHQQFSYDALGNISYMEGVGNFSYSTTSYANPHAVTSVNGVAYTYDNNGNLTLIGSGIGSTAYSWDWRDRLTQSATGTATSTFGYDDQNMRVRRTVLGVATTTYVNQWFNFSTVGTSTVPSTTTAHILLPDGTPIATVEANGTATSTYWLHLDHLGGIHTVTNASGTPVETTSYYSYGDQRIASSSTGFREQKKYTGHDYDTDSDLTYAKARYYEQDIGRFLSQDPVFNRIGDPKQLKDRHQVSRNSLLKDPQRLNAYSYARNNPTILIDRAGEDAGMSFLLGYSALMLVGLQKQFAEADIEHMQLNREIYSQAEIDKAQANLDRWMTTQGVLAVVSAGFGGVVDTGLTTLGFGSDLKDAYDSFFPESKERAKSVIEDAESEDPLDLKNQRLRNQSNFNQLLQQGSSGWSSVSSSGASSGLSSGSAGGRGTIFVTGSSLPRSREPIGQTPSGSAIYCWGQCR